MKKLGLIVKETSERRIKENLEKSESVLVLHYSGLSSPALTSLRKAMNETNSRFVVVQNAVARRALKSAGYETLVGSIEGPCGLVFVPEEPVAVSKALFAFMKENEKLRIGAGIFREQLLEKKDIEALAKLPSRDALRAQLVCVLAAPMSGLVRTLHQTMRKFVYCIDQVRQKKAG